MADETGEKPWWQSLPATLTAPATTDEQAKAMKLAALLQAQGDNGLETTAYKGIHAMPTAAAGFGNALQKGVSGYMAGMAGQKNNATVTNSPLQHAVGTGGAGVDYVTPNFQSSNFLSNLFGG